MLCNNLIYILNRAGGPPREMYAEPVKPLNEYEVGDSIVCFAHGYPQPSFEWINMRTFETFHDSVLTIPEEWLGTTQIMTCVASNKFDDASFSTDHLITVTVPG